MRKLLFGCLFLPFAAAAGRADSPVPPTSYVIVLPGGEYIFVMISPLTPDQEASWLKGERKEEMRAIRRKYATSGLYRNDGSSDAIWTVGWYDNRSSIAIASDGVHLVQCHHLASRPDGVAVAFFVNGEELRSYRVSELIRHPDRLPHSVTTISWAEEHAFDDKALTFSVRTKEGVSYLFDVTTGSVIPSRPPHWLLGALAVAALVLLVLILRAIWNKRRRASVGGPKARRAPDPVS
jgi:hypothetical protein